MQWNSPVQIILWNFTNLQSERTFQIFFICWDLRKLLPKTLSDIQDQNCQDKAFLMHKNGKFQGYIILRNPIKIWISTFCSPQCWPCHFFSIFRFSENEMRLFLSIFEAEVDYCSSFFFREKYTTFSFLPIAIVI